MDRRRFVPAPEGLEGRKLLASFLSAANPFGALGGSTTVQPAFQLNTAAEQATRIRRLPYFLQQTEVRRALPPSVINPIQQDLSAIQNKLPKPAASPLLQQFNLLLRDAMPRANLPTGDAVGLNKAFGAILVSAGASPEQAATFQADMNRLVQLDIESPETVRLVTNDYATILQTALGVGRPIATPTVPTLVLADTAGKKGGRVVNTPHPAFIGTYTPNTIIQILSPDGSVIGSGPVNSRGNYIATVATPLSPGIYSVRFRAQDNFGNLSLPTAPFVFKVIAPHRAVATQVGVAHPAGPLARTTG